MLLVGVIEAVVPALVSLIYPLKALNLPHLICCLRRSSDLLSQQQYWSNHKLFMQVELSQPADPVFRSIIVEL